MRGYIEMLDRIIVYLSDPLHVVQPDDMIEISVAQNPFQVFDAHCAKIGLLRDAAESVVKTYGCAKSIVQDLRVLPERHKRLPLTREQLLAFHRDLKAMFTETIACGELAVRRLKQEEARGFLTQQKRNED